jgi:hypothetical protein
MRKVKRIKLGNQLYQRLMSRVQGCTHTLGAGMLE